MLKRSRSIIFMAVPALTLLGLSLLSFVCLTSTTVSAEETVLNNVDISVPVSCNLNSSVDTAHTAIVNAGTSVSDIGTTNFTVFCNDASGFALYAIGYTNEDYGDNTLVGQSTNNIINTGTATTGNNSAWAMKMVKVTDGSYQPNNLTITNNFNNYKEVPDTYTKVAEYTSSTDATLGSKLQSTYRAFMSTFQDADTYKGKVKYTLVHPYDTAAPVTPLDEADCPANNVCYAPNAGDLVGSMDSISSTKIAASPTAGVQINVGATPTLIVSNYSRVGYGFAGWSPDFNATTSSIIYGPNETLANNDTTKGLILYPVWVKSNGGLQGWTGCSSLTQATYNSTTGKMNATLSSVTALTDQRDNQTYAVARLADGNCWMIENLRLESENTIGDANRVLSQGYASSTTYGSFIGLADSEMSFALDYSSENAATPANSIYYAGTQSGTATIDISQTKYAYSRMPRYNNNNTNRLFTANYSRSGSSYQWYSYGNYYSSAAAMANTRYYSTIDGTDEENKTSETVGTSICPFGWKLPYGGNTGRGITSGGFAYLDQQMGGSGNTSNGSTNPTGVIRSIILRTFPNNFIYAGRINNDATVTERNAMGYYNSSTVSGSSVYQLMFSDNSYYPGTSSNYVRSMGRSIRCVAGS